jgi:hypothetical protein
MPKPRPQVLRPFAWYKDGIGRPQKRFSQPVGGLLSSGQAPGVSGIRRRASTK